MAIITVTTLDDTVVAPDGQVSLREALQAANNDISVDGSTAGAGADDIVFDPILTNGTLTLAQGELTIESDITIDGDTNGDDAPDITIDGGDDSRVITIYVGTSTLNGLTITGGYDSANGGGIAIGVSFFGAYADVTVSNSVVTDNTAGYGGGISVDTGSSLRLTNSTLAGNSAYDAGGGIANAGTLTMINTTVSGNQADLAQYGYGGGGLYNSGTATLLNSTFSDNTSLFAGGGILNYEGDLTLVNTTLSRNAADLMGGGITNFDGTLDVISSTLSGNFAGVGGGGIANYGTLNVTNSIVAGNADGGAAPDIYTNTAATYSGINVVSQAGIVDPAVIVETDLANIFANVVQIDPTPAAGDEFQAGELADNGGPVQTIAILGGGVAHDAGDTTELPDDTEDLDGDNDVGEDLPVEARGQPRVSGGTVDSGAFEVQANNTDPVQGVNTGLTLDEGAVAALLAAQLDFNDAEQGDADITYTIAAATTNGTLFLNGNPLGLGNTFTQDDINNNRVTYTHDGSDTTADSFGFTVSDGAGGAVPGQTFDFTINPIDDAPGATLPNDINGDNTSDIVWRDNAGTVALWEMDGVNVLGNHEIGTLPNYWQIVDADSDFNGDGRSDILWRDEAGVVVLWEMNGPDILGNTAIATLPDYWHIADTGDFTGDGRADILWRDTAGRVVLWEMDGADIVGNTFVADVATTSQIQDTADFTGDGRNDILWRDPDGTIRLWEMDGATVVGDTAIAVLPDHWQFAGSGDFNGDGRFDILWRDTAGTVVLWEMDGPAIIGNTARGTLPSYWNIADVGDYTGDLNHDILWRDSAGTIVLWEMNGPMVIDDSAINTIPTNWHIVA